MFVTYLETDGDTTIELPIPLEIEGYGCGVIDMHGKIKSDKEETLYLCSDICEESIVNGIKMPVLHSIYVNPKNNRVNKPIYNVIWLRVMRPAINNIRLYIADKYGKPVSFEDSILECTLLFTPNSKNHEY